MYELFEILKYTLPSIIVFLTAYLSFKSFIKKESQIKKYELMLNNQKYIAGIKLQAYERCILLLERISPESLLKRVHKKGMTCNNLQNIMLSTIRNEFEHNYSQQLYISNDAWQMIIKAKENTIKIINTISAKCKQDDPAINLSKAILESVMYMDKKPVAPAVEFLKKEVKALF
jgi:hypothetical protein